MIKKNLAIFFVFALAPLVLAQGPRENFQKLRTQYQELLAAHRPAIKDAKEGTVAIVRGETLVSLGCVVRPDGWILAKASEITDGKPFEVLIGKDRKVKGDVMQVFEKHDLALVQIKAKGLKPIKWYTGGPPVVGSFVAAAGPKLEDPIAIGVYSVKARNMDKQERAFLGVQLDANDEGVIIGTIIDDTPRAAWRSQGQ